ncbi:MAG: DEAD/DEAH box helicase [Candidatus Methylomirabilales bacterium]
MALAFRNLNLPEAIRRGIAAAGFTECTPIQEQTLPVALSGKDVAGQAPTGTGKTAAFLITAFSRLLRSGKEAVPGRPRALVMAPTRELTVQIHEDARLLGQHTHLRTLAIYGGIDYEKQREALRRPLDLVVGTPGRLIDYLKQRVYDLRAIEILVIDEADRMFDMGFIKDIRYLLRRMPPYHTRQSFLFSATLSYREMELAYEFMNGPVRVSTTPEHLTVEEVEEVLYHVERREKFPLLLGLLKREKGERILIFANTKREAEWLAHRLELHGYQSRAITGDLEQKKRLRTIKQFKAGELPILVATDVASRGLHIEGVTHVVNYDVPQNPEDYVHRIGRTARAGASGKAITLADEVFVLGLEPIEQMLGYKIPVQWPEDSLFITPRTDVPSRPPRSARPPAGPRDPRRRERWGTSGAGPGSAQATQAPGHQSRRRKQKQGGSRAGQQS